MRNVDSIVQALGSCETIPRVGKVSQFYGLAVESIGPDVFLGELCEIYPPAGVASVVAEVVGFRDGKVMLMPYGSMHGVYIGSEIIATGRSASVPVGPELMGRVVDAFCQPIDGGDTVNTVETYPLYPEPINPLLRAPIEQTFDTGVAVIDSFLTLGQGQRMGVFSGSGVGKSTLLGMVAKNSQADVNVIALIGERGREVIDFVRNSLGDDGLAKSVLIVAGADQPALVRTHAAFAATALAEYFKDQGQQVFLAMDSVTRFAIAQREIGLAIGEPPTARGYTPSTFSLLPRLAERAGNFISGGSITGLYTVLVEGDDFNEPITDNLRAILDGHVVLSRKMANQGQLPAVSVLESISRLQSDLLTDEEQQLVRRALKLFSIYEENNDLVQMGVYQQGRNIEHDEALAVIPKIQDLLAQKPSEVVTRDALMVALATMLNTPENGPATSPSAKNDAGRTALNQSRRG